MVQSWLAAKISLKIVFLIITIILLNFPWTIFQNFTYLTHLKWSITLWWVIWFVTELFSNILFCLMYLLLVHGSSFFCIDRSIFIRSTSKPSTISIYEWVVDCWTSSTNRPLFWHFNSIHFSSENGSDGFGELSGGPVNWGPPRRWSCASWRPSAACRRPPSTWPRGRPTPPSSAGARSTSTRCVGCWNAWTASRCPTNWPASFGRRPSASSARRWTRCAACAPTPNWTRIRPTWRRCSTVWPCWKAEDEVVDSVGFNLSLQRFKECSAVFIRSSPGTGYGDPTNSTSFGLAGRPRTR